MFVIVIVAAGRQASVESACARILWTMPARILSGALSVACEFLCMWGFCIRLSS